LHVKLFGEILSSTYLLPPSAHNIIPLMAIEFVPLPLPSSADASKFLDFGREVKGVNPGSFSPDEFELLTDAVYKVNQTCSTSVYETQVDLLVRSAPVP
jgi:hypothetical protein